MKLCRLVRPLQNVELITALQDSSWVPVEPIEDSFSVDSLDELISALIADPCITDGGYDLHLVEPIYQLIAPLPRIVATDVRLWHWLCVVAFPHLVWHRWLGHLPDTPEEGLQGIGRGRAIPPVRFLGTASLNGFGRNTFARLFFAADRVSGDLERARRMFSSQELHLGLMDRELSLCKPVAATLVDWLAGSSDQEIRAGIKRLNHIGGGLVLDLLEPDELVELLNE
ncbi:DUF6339 family protein [Synechococcus elongatus]|uniref:DUF6339 family protein n=1 Tax=Synechococcus elongatus TaxID=32046 RepID=UPI0030D2AABB